MRSGITGELVLRALISGSKTEEELLQSLFVYRGPPPRKHWRYLAEVLRSLSLQGKVVLDADGNWARHVDHNCEETMRGLIPLLRELLHVLELSMRQRKDCPACGTAYNPPERQPIDEADKVLG